MDVYKEDGLFENALALEPYLENAIHGLKGLPNVIDIRNMGLVAAVELAPRPGAPGERGYDAMVQAFNKGLMIRVTADIIALSPPLIIDRPQIDQIAQTLREVLARTE